MGEFLSYYCSLDCGSPTRQVWYLIFVMTAPLRLFNCSLFFVFRHGVSLFGGFLHPPVDGCSTASYDSGALCRRRWAHILLLYRLEPEALLLNLLRFCLCIFIFLVFWPQGMWDPSSPTRSLTHTPCIGKWSLNHWTTMEVPLVDFSLISKDVSLLFFTIYFHPHL